MASSYNRKSDSSASRAQRRAAGAGGRSSAPSNNTSRTTSRADATRKPAGERANATRRPKGSMDDKAIARAAAAAMSGGSSSEHSSSRASGDSIASSGRSVSGAASCGASNVRAFSSAGVSAPRVTSRRSTTGASAGNRSASAARSSSSARGGYGAARTSASDFGAAGTSSSTRSDRAGRATRRNTDERVSVDAASRSSRRKRAGSDTDAAASSTSRKSVRSSRSSRRNDEAAESSRKSRKSVRSLREDKAAQSSAAIDSTKLDTAAGDAAAVEDSTAGKSKREGRKEKKEKNRKERKSIHGERKSRSARKKDDAPAGTSDLSVSENAQRERNRDVDEVAASGGRRVGDIRASRAAERAARARKKYLSYVLKLAAVVATVLVVVFGSIFIYRSNLLAIQTVTVSGAEHLTDQEVTQLAAVPDDSTLLRLDTAGICERLEEHPWVQSAQVVRQFPNSIKIQITERTPSAVVKISKKSIWVISTDGAWLSAATKADWKNYRRIVDADATMSAPVAGSECTNEGVLNALKIYDGVSSKLAEQISSISAESAVKTSLTLKDGVTVAFGEASDLELKEADIFALLDQYSGTVSYINVRVPDRPTYRTAKEG